LAACIEDAGFQIATAWDGAEALQKIQADPPDLMTLDMVMPRVSGINLMRQLRSRDSSLTGQISPVAPAETTRPGRKPDRRADAFGRQVKSPAIPDLTADADTFGRTTEMDRMPRGTLSGSEQTRDGCRRALRPAGSRCLMPDTASQLL
jgi:CheY-like chemotaxis protein